MNATDCVVVLPARVKVAVHPMLAAGIVKLAGVALPLGQGAVPDQPANVDPEAAVAVKDTIAPTAYVPAPDTVPLPVPAV